jgi:riboflavin kinase/FMN adenylyltransferase
MHLAHQKLFSNLCKNGAIVVIQTSYANLSPKTHRSEHTNYPIFYYPLENIKHLSGEQFVKLLYEEFPKLEKIVVGYDFHFGHNASSSTEDLKKLFKGDVVVIDEFKVNGIAVHSRIIREYLRAGDIKEANALLGYEYIISGIHIKGQGIGKKQFVATINLDVDEFLLPQEGVYVTKTFINGTYLPSVSFIGHRVTTDGKYAVETHIFSEIDNEHSSKTLKIKFFEKIRGNKKFEVYEDLKLQILDDIQKAKNYFKL